jgi:predicted permease
VSDVRRFLLRILNAFRGAAPDRELEREIDAHLGLIEEDLARRGMPASEAKRNARIALGGVTQTMERSRDARRFAWLDDARRDVSFAVRLLGRQPVFALTAVLSLAIGIGANTAVFTIANALLFRSPAGVVAPDRLVDIGTSNYGNGFNTTSYPNYVDLRERATLLAEAYAYSLFPESLMLGRAETERVFGTHVTANYFDALGAVPAAGRLFTERDSNQGGTSSVVVLSHAFWTRKFGGDAGVIGRTLEINRQPYTIVGVSAPGFQGTGVRSSDVWLPMSTAGPAMLTNRAGGWLLVGARLRPGVSVSAAAGEVGAIARALASEHPEEDRTKGFVLQSLSPVPGTAGPIVAFLGLLVCIVSAVLVTACANIAGVLLVRAAARRREIAVRLALGAGRSRLIRQLLTEAAMLFALGACAGLVIARIMTSLLVSSLPALPFSVNVALGLDARAIAFTAGLALITAVASGLAPALRASRADVVTVLKGESPLLDRLRLRNVFVAGQVAASMLLVIVAGLFARALQSAGAGDPGFDPRGVDVAPVNLSIAGYTNETAPLFARDLLARIRALPEVQSATIAAVLPGGFERLGLGAFGVSGGQPPTSVDGNIIEPGYFATMRIPIAAGRDFTESDRSGVEPVAIVGEGVVRRFWPGLTVGDAVGKELVQRNYRPQSKDQTVRIVGVARDPKYGTLLEGTTGLYVYVPLQQQYLRGATMIVARARGGRLGEALRSAVAAADRNLQVAPPQSAEEYTSLGLVPQRVAASAAGSLGLVGILLASIGIYGVTAYTVARRTHEIGIRMALGARGSDVMRLVLQQSMSLVAAGSIVGLGVGLAANRLLGAYLLGLPSMDPVTFIMAAAIFAAIGAAACAIPARRAVRISAMEALRYE